MSKCKNLTGQRFGKLVVIKRIENKVITSSGKSYVQWECQCDCGNTKKVLSCNLLNGTTQSCGCCRGIGNRPLSYDFYLPNQNLLIECQGEQHYYPVDIYGGEEHFEIQQEHDRRKREYATANGYNLIEIPYYDYDNIEEILDKVLSTSKVGNS